MVTRERRFVGPRAKLRRAQRKIQALKESFDSFVGANLYRVYSEFDREAGYHVLKAYPVAEAKEPPIIGWSLLVGEIAYNLRSALDQAVCELATERGADCESTSFPIFPYGPRAKTRRSRRARLNFRWNGDDIKPLSYRHRWIIESVQPYHRVVGDQVAPTGNRRPFYSLWLLHEMSNADKHRELVKVDATPMGTALNVLNDDIEYEIDPGAAVYDGAEVGWLTTTRPPEQIHVDGYLAIQICFGDALPTLDQWSVMQVLEWIARTVENVLYDLARGEPWRTRGAHLRLPVRYI